ncbi:hypothetical protein AB0H43_26565 [Hamadaea sp. NPDC050747]|uniref:hypothetical protein n=1 Tax=Hamadaea sp. NPDC050747 TaxID=3155789 RepID=UPI0033C345FA
MSPSIIVQHVQVRWKQSRGGQPPRNVTASRSPTRLSSSSLAQQHLVTHDESDAFIPRVETRDFISEAQRNRLRWAELTLDRDGEKSACLGSPVIRRRLFTRPRSMGCVMPS